ncbi:MAG: tetratricopeptide repeat protein [Armatimonadetes bacterium]|nr:tetratricopeptide repeat protein [Armatimonadota bacterium]NIO95959.1 tetratricopeptide repeat protein [Armatimonadota bacterium]
MAANSMLVVVIAILALIVIIALLLFRRKAKMEINGPLVTGVKVDGSNAAQPEEPESKGTEAGRDKIFYQTSSPTVTSLHQLPTPPGDFTGREAELKDLMEAMQERGIAISGLRGAGGIGKTALALKLAERLKESYPDAQFFLDLKGTSEPLTATEAMAHIIRGHQPEARLPDDEAQLNGLYRSVLDGKRALLLMDNARSAEQVEPLIPPAGCVMLITSRWKFALPDLAEKDLDIMSEGDARDLLLKIAPHIGDHADEIARLCGYFPLALRLAASALVKSKIVSPADYVSRLKNARGAAELIQPSLNLTYELLDEEMQRLWRMLAVFPGRFDTAGVAAVWKIPQEKAEDALNTLISYSLVECDETTHRCHLHDLARDFAESQLSEDERQQAQFRHAEHYKNVLADAGDLCLEGGEAMMRGLAIFDLERGNIQGGQAWAAAHWREDDEAARLCGEYPDAGGDVIDLRQHPQEQISWLESALAAARRLKDRESEGRHLGSLGGVYTNSGDSRRAIEYCQKAVDMYREIGDRFGEAVNVGSLGFAYAHLGETRRAIECYEDAIGIAREMKDRAMESQVLGHLGLAYGDLGEPRRAVECYEQQLSIIRKIGYRQGEGSALWNISLALDALGERDEAIPKAEAALEIYEQIEAPDAAKVREQLEEWRKK